MKNKGELHPVGLYPVHEGRKWGNRPRWLEKHDTYKAFARYMCMYVLVTFFLRSCESKPMYIMLWGNPQASCEIKLAKSQLFAT